MTNRPGRGTARVGRVMTAALALLAVVAAGCSNPQQVGLPNAQFGVVTQITCTTARHCLALGASQKGASSSAYVLASNDAGGSWQPEQHPPVMKTLAGLSCWDAEHCMVVNLSTGAVTSDGGTRWQTLPPVPVYASAGGALDCPAPSTCYVVGSAPPGSGHVLLNSAVGVTTNGGATWSVYDIPQAATITPASISCLSATTCLAVGATATTGGHAAVWETTDSGATWSDVPAPQLTALRSISCTTGTLFCVAVGSGQQVATTTDGGTTWLVTAVPVPPNLGQLTATACADTTHCVVTTLTQAVGVTGDGGKSYSKESLPTSLVSQSVYCTGKGICLIGGDWIGQVIDAGMVARSTDHGRTWTTAWMSN